MLQNKKKWFPFYLQVKSLLLMLSDEDWINGITRDTKPILPKYRQTVSPFILAPCLRQHSNCWKTAEKTAE